MRLTIFFRYFRNGTTQEANGTTSLVYHRSLAIDSPIILPYVGRSPKMESLTERVTPKCFHNLQIGMHKYLVTLAQ
jgi:hypothetical protein